MEVSQRVDRTTCLPTEQCMVQSKRAVDKYDNPVDAKKGKKEAEELCSNFQDFECKEVSFC